MKKERLILVGILLFILIVTINIPLYAVNNITLKVIQKASEIQYLDKEQGNISKTIFNNTSSANIGIIDFHGENGWFGTAGIGNATLRKKPSNNKEEILEELEKLNSASVVSRN